MPNFSSNDPRALRTRQALQEAFLALLQVKPYQRITITDITKRAGFARHTFYNHYETKDDLLSHVIDAVLDKFFTKLEKWNLNLDDSKGELKMIASFFYVWQDNVEIVRILNNL